MHKKVIVMIVAIVMLMGCKRTEELPPYWPGIDTYNSFDELIQSFDAATSPNAQAHFKNEKVYYLPEGNALGMTLVEIQVRESYFNCVYDNGVNLVTNRYEDGTRVLRNTVNNAGDFTKKQGDGFEYYYVSSDDIQYYAWIYQDDTYMQYNVPVEVDIGLSDIIQNMTYMPVDR